MSVVFEVQEFERWTVVEFKLDGPIEPAELRHIEPPAVNPRKGVIISGRGPIWLYCFLAHHYHPAVWVATFDPRLGAVVVQTHTKDYKEGDVIDIS